MKGGKTPLGYTIVEVMIVLAISGVTFLIAATFINGKQQRSAFTSGTNELASRLQDTIEQIVDGRYSDLDLTCIAPVGGGGGSNITFNNSGNTQGNNQDCVFLGKFIHFYRNGTAQAESYEVFSLTQPRQDPSDASKPLTAFPNTYIIPIDKNGIGGGSTTLTTTSNNPQSLDITRVTITRMNDTTDTSGFGVGFVQSAGTGNSTDPSGQSLSSGGQSLRLVYVPNLANIIGSGINAAVRKVAGNNIQEAKAAQICVTDGTRFANILVGIDTTGDQAGQLSVNVQQRGTTAC